MLKTKLTLGQKASDRLSEIVGSWRFISILVLFIVFWIFLNIAAFISHWDPWPFILLNLSLSCLAALQAPIILMSQNRAAERDRRRFEYDYKIDRKTWRDMEYVKNELKSIKKTLQKTKKKH
jgi:uncharacterized membrane protein